MKFVLIVHIKLMARKVPCDFCEVVGYRVEMTNHLRRCIKSQEFIETANLRMNLNAKGNKKSNSKKQKICEA